MMLPGEIARIRVNPRDCMGVVDVLKNTGMYTEGMSFSAGTSLVFSALLESARQAGLIPMRDGFEYTEMMQPFLDKSRGKKKLEITRLTALTGSELQVPALSHPTARSVANVGKTMAQRRARTRINELGFKKEQAPDSWTAADEEEIKWHIRVEAEEIDPLDETKWPAALRP